MTHINYPPPGEGNWRQTDDICAISGEPILSPILSSPTEAQLGGRQAPMEGTILASTLMRQRSLTPNSVWENKSSERCAQTVQSNAN